MLFIDKLPALSPECTLSNLMIMCLQTGFKFFCGSLFSLFWGTNFIRTNSSQQGDQKGSSSGDSHLISYRIKWVYLYRDCRLGWSVYPIAYPARTVIVVTIISDSPPVVRGWEHKPLCRWSTSFTGIKWLACVPQLIGSKSQISSQTHSDSPAPLQALEATCSFCSCAKVWESRIRSCEDVNNPMSAAEAFSCWQGPLSWPHHCPIPTPPLPSSALPVWAISTIFSFWFQRVYTDVCV